MLRGIDLSRVLNIVCCCESRAWQTSVLSYGLDFPSIVSQWDRYIITASFIFSYFSTKLAFFMNYTSNRNSFGRYLQFESSLLASFVWHQQFWTQQHFDFFFYWACAPFLLWGQSLGICYYPSATGGYFASLASFSFFSCCFEMTFWDTSSNMTSTFSPVFALVE